VGNLKLQNLFQEQLSKIISCKEFDCANLLLQIKQIKRMFSKQARQKKDKINSVFTKAQLLPVILNILIPSRIFPVGV
jgi:hypothetical protein